MSTHSVARFVKPREGPTYSILGDLCTIKMSGEDTGGVYALFELFVPPDNGPPKHIHTREEECFYVLEGELTLYIDDNRVVVGPGGFLNTVRNVPHRLCNEGSRPARALCMVTPAGLDQYFMEVGVPVTDPANPPPIDHTQVEKLIALAPKYGLTILPSD